MRGRNGFVNAPKPASDADFGVATALIWRIGPGADYLATNSALNDAAKASVEPHHLRPALHQAL
jgi:hypothetical protein